MYPINMVILSVIILLISKQQLKCILKHVTIPFCLALDLTVCARLSW
jgi:hypothetical protein